MLSPTRTVAALALAAGGLFALPGTASATPGSCSITHPGGISVAGKCTSGTGEYRIVADCILVTPTVIKEFTKVGPWVGIGATSTVSCGNRPPAGELQFR